MTTPRPLPVTAMRHAFLGVLNGRSLLALLGLTAVVALTRWLAAWGQGVTVRLPTVSGLATTLLLPGLLMLLAAAATEAWLARRAGRPSDWWWRIGMVMGACALVLAWRVLSWPDPRAPVYWGYFFSRTLLFGSLGAAVYGLLVLSQRDARARTGLLQAKVQRDRLRAQQMQAQLSALNAQIEPHFLFNTLATVKRLIEIQPERGRVMLSRLIAYLRASLPSLRGQDSDLRTELEAVRNYLTLLQMRMGERLRFQIEAKTGLLGLRLPPLLLVTLVENAVTHGLSPLPEGGHVWVRARAGQDASVLLEVEDDGRGFGPSAGGSGLGLANTRARLLACFGPTASLSLVALPRGVLARIRVPAAKVSA